MRAELENLPACEPDGRNWFWHGEQILALLDVHKPKVCVELGTYKGGSAIAVGRVVRKWHGAVHCFDTWDGDVSMGECWQNIQEAGLTEVITIQRSRTDRAAERWHGLIDYLYVDADHSYEGCLSDLELWWPHLRVGGLIAGDDYDDPRWDVTRAWDIFELACGQKFHRQATPGSDPACTRLIWGVKR